MLQSANVFILLDHMRRSMWLPGHLAVGFFICLIPLLFFVQEGKSAILGLIYIAFFAVLLDFLHFGEGPRAFSHSFFGAAVLLSFALLITIIIHGWQRWLTLIAILAVGSHLLADLFIGHIYPWYPWSMEIVQNNVFNTIFDIRVELILCFLALIPLTALIALKYGKSSLANLSRNELLAVIFLLGSFFIFALVQSIYYASIDIFRNPTISAILLGFVFISVIALSGLYLSRSVRALTAKI